MPQVFYIKTNFTSGEFAPALKGRVDLQKYADGVETLQNYVVLPHGGIKRRGGLHHVNEVKVSADEVRLIPFQFNVTQTYMIEASDLYFRYYTLNGRLESGGSPVETVTPYLDSEVRALDWAQDADNLYLAHASHASQILTRTSATAFSIAALDYVGGPFVEDTDANYGGLGTGYTMTAGVVTKAASTTLVCNTNFFTADMVGMYIRLGSITGGVQGYALITAVADPQNATITNKETLTATAVTTDWALGSWGDETGWPQKVTFFQQRLLFANTANEPQTIWGSAIDVPTNFDHVSDVESDSSFKFTVAANQVNVIEWLSAQQDLLIGTAGGEYLLSGGTESAVSPTNVIVRPQSRYGSGAIRPIQVANVTLYVQRAKRKLQEISFDLNQDAYLSENLLLLSRHLTEGTDKQIHEVEYQQEPDSVVWVVLEDGTLLSMTWLRSQNVVAWGTHPLTGTVKSIGVIPSTTTGNDQVWAVIERTINGSVVKHVEYIDPDIMVDSGLTGLAGPRTISGLGHLEGEEVQIKGDGAVYKSQTVTSGSVTIEDDEPDLTTAEVGLGYTSTVTLLEPDVTDATGTSLGRKKAFRPVFIRVLDTLTVNVNGKSEGTPYLSSETVMGTAPVAPTEQDIKVANLQKGDGKVTVSQPNPLQTHIIAIFGKLTIGDD